MKIRGASFIFIVLCLISASVLTRCAKQGSPSGGPKDIVPPIVMVETPPNHSVRFDAEKVTLTFNEFIQLKDPAKEIFISPPMRTRPEFKAQGKKVIVTFMEPLKDSSTYTINFGSSITDFTEGNPLVNYEYVFSTGDHLDSLYVHGIVVNAFTLQPEPEIIVMVYQDNNDTIPLDSLPLRVPPRSASKTTKDGKYSINNLPAGEYKLFAIQDLNNNYVFDLPNERIAFLDSMIRITSPLPVVPPATYDSLSTADSGYFEPLTDTAAFSGTNDSAGVYYLASGADSLMVSDSLTGMPAGEFYTLYLFEEIDPTQKLLGKKLIGRNLLQYIFRMPADSLHIQPVGFEPPRQDWYIPEPGVLGDTVNLWLRPGLPDTIRVYVSERDSVADTSRFILPDPLTERLGRRKELIPKALGISANLFGGNLDLNRDLKLKFSAPVTEFDTAKMILCTPADTLVPVFGFSDSLQRYGEIKYTFPPGASCQLILVDSAFMDLSGLYNDSIIFNFRVRALEDYGVLLMNITLPDTSGQYILQLMTDKEAVVQQMILASGGLVRFEYLMPGKFKLKAVFDKNLNGKWDPGKYTGQILPEKVAYFKNDLNIRANWELQEDWILE